MNLRSTNLTMYNKDYIIKERVKIYNNNFLKIQNVLFENIVICKEYSNLEIVNNLKYDQIRNIKLNLNNDIGHNLVLPKNLQNLYINNLNNSNLSTIEYFFDRVLNLPKIHLNICESISYSNYNIFENITSLHVFVGVILDVLPNSLTSLRIGRYDKNWLNEKLIEYKYLYSRVNRDINLPVLPSSLKELMIVQLFLIYYVKN